MKIYFNLLGDRLDGVSYFDNGQDFSAEVPGNHEVITNPEVFKYENGRLIKDEAYHQELIDEQNSEKQKPSDEELNAIALMELTEKILGR